MTDKLILKAVIKGLLTYLPGMQFLKRKIKRINHSSSDAMFCYTLWLRILVFLKENGIKPKVEFVGEVGTGGSLGVGICSLLTGTEKYFALEAEQLINKKKNLDLLDDLVILFRNQTLICREYSRINIKIANYDFPSDLIKDYYLHDEIISSIKEDIQTGFESQNRISLIRQWEGHPSLALDFAFSRAVMEHVQSPLWVYKGLYNHLKEDCLMIHDIEFHSHGITKNRDGHYFIKPKLWGIIFGNRPYFINRWKLDDHIECLKSLGFKLIASYKNYMKDEETDMLFLDGATLLVKKKSDL